MNWAFITFRGTLVLTLSGIFMLLHGMVGYAVEAQPVLIGIDAEFGVPGSSSAQAVRLGVRIAVDEINRAGGVLGGRPLRIVERDNRSVPARSLENLRELAGQADLVAVFCGKYSPVVVETLPLIHELKLPLLDPWAAADSVTEHAYRPSYTFRLSLRDSWAIRAMLAEARKRGYRRIGFMAPNTEWGRSSLRAMDEALGRSRDMSLAGVEWYHWGDESLIEQYRRLLERDMDALLLVANEREGGLLVREMAGLAKDRRRPILSHWGVTGGLFFENSRGSLDQVDFSVVQTYSFLNARRPRVKTILEAARRLEGIVDARKLYSPVGIAHAYDLTHILARAIDLAGGTDREAVRDALEQVRNYDGLIKHYARPFSAKDHDALGPETVFMARYARDGAITPKTRRIGE